jgi:hypothetical protein
MERCAASLPCWTCIDVDAPQNYKLVFSDEFNLDGRTFDPCVVRSSFSEAPGRDVHSGMDPFWCVA